MNICLRCGKDFSRKDNLKRHFRNKKICKSIFLDVPPILLLTDYEKFLLVYKNMVSDPKVIQVPQKSDPKVIQGPQFSDPKVIQQRITKIECEYCGNEFNKKTNYYRHKRDRCIVLNKEKEDQEILKEYIDAKHEVLRLENEENQDKIKEELGEKIRLLEEQIVQQQLVQTNIGGDVNNNINNGNIINNIMINNFGEEKYNLTSEEVEEIMAAKYNMHTALIKKIHIDNQENRNFMVVSMKDKYAIIVKDGEKVYINRIDTIDKFVTGKTLLLGDLLEEHGKNFKEINPDYVGNVINFCSKDPEECKRIRSDVTLLFFNNKDIIKHTIDNNCIKNI